MSAKAAAPPIIRDADSIQKLTFDNETTWLLFPARLSCGESRFDSTRRSIIVDYTEGPKIQGYRDVPDRLAGPEGLNIRDEIRLVRPGFYLGRAYFDGRFGLNFTLIDPAGAAAATAVSAATPEEAGVLLWNTLGSPQEITNSQVGPGGSQTAGTFVTGVFGHALKASYAEDRPITFPLGRYATCARPRNGSI